MLNKLAKLYFIKIINIPNPNLIFITALFINIFNNFKAKNMPVERLTLKDEHELERLVLDEINTFEKKLTPLLKEVTINEKTKLDILCHDDNGRLVVLKLSLNENNNMIFEGLRSLDYVNKFKTMLNMTYAKAKLDITEKPKLILVAPSYSEDMLNLVKHITGFQIDLYCWEYLKLGDQKGLRLQPVYVPHAPPEPHEEPKPPRPPKTEEKKTHKKEEPEPQPKEEAEPPKKVITPPPPPPPTPKPPETPKKEEPLPKKEEAKKKSFFSI